MFKSSKVEVRVLVRGVKDKGDIKKNAIKREQLNSFKLPSGSILHEVNTNALNEAFELGQQIK